MTRGVIAIKPDADMNTIIEQFGDHRIRRLLVVDSSDRLVGIVAWADVAPYVSDSKVGQAVSEVVERPKDPVRAREARAVGWLGQSAACPGCPGQCNRGTLRFAPATRADAEHGKGKCPERRLQNPVLARVFSGAGLRARGFGLFRGHGGPHHCFHYVLGVLRSF